MTSSLEMDPVYYQWIGSILNGKDK